MNFSRPSRFFAALVTLFCLLFTQLALASYVCPQSARAQLSLSAESSTAVLPDCGEMDTQQPSLCNAHCDDGKQTLDTSVAPHVGPFVPSTLIFVLHAANQAAPLLGSGEAALPLQRATAPPVAIRNCCFLI
ncbi:MAG: hypothetical protein H7176_13225 [Bdellovibrionales bacterium]|nr:hypothetical protein [Massilia sp.]